MRWRTARHSDGCEFQVQRVQFYQYWKFLSLLGISNCALTESGKQILCIATSSVLGGELQGITRTWVKSENEKWVWDQKLWKSVVGNGMSERVTGD